MMQGASTSAAMAAAGTEAFETAAMLSATYTHDGDNGGVLPRPPATAAAAAALAGREEDHAAAARLAMQEHMVQMRMALQMQQVIQTVVLVFAFDLYMMVRGRDCDLYVFLLLFGASLLCWRLDIFIQMNMPADTAPLARALKYLQFLLSLAQTLLLYVAVKLLSDRVASGYEASLDAETLLRFFGVMALVVGAMVMMQNLLDTTPLRARLTPPRDRFHAHAHALPDMPQEARVTRRRRARETGASHQSLQSPLASDAEPLDPEDVPLHSTATAMLGAWAWGGSNDVRSKVRGRDNQPHGA